MATVTTPAQVGKAGASIVLRGRADVRGAVITSLLLGCLGISLLFLVALMANLFIDGQPILTGRLGDFLGSTLNTDPMAAGVWQGIRGTLTLAVIVALVAFPLGVGCAVWLEEYASDGWFARLVSVNIRNLAGVPSIVYGLLGLAVFVQVLGPVTGGRTVIAGGLTLSALVLPIIIITAQEAVRAVPASIKEGSLALGATRWETVRHHIVPSAAPGILTGTVLSLARAAGEAAPLLVVGAITGVFFTGAQGFWDQILNGRFTALPMIIFSWARLPAGQGWNVNAAAAGFVLVLLIVAINAVAIYFRNRYETKW
jgi:phosphate transport system permease protein